MRTPRLIDPFLLSVAETEVLRLIASSYSNKEIAQLRKRSIKTVIRQRESLMQKLEVHDMAAVTRYALANGMIHNEFSPDSVFGMLDYSE